MSLSRALDDLSGHRGRPRGASVGFAAMLAMRPRLFSGATTGECLALKISCQALARLQKLDSQQFRIFFINLSRDMSRFKGDCIPRPPAEDTSWPVRLNPGLLWKSRTWSFFALCFTISHCGWRHPRHKNCTLGHPLRSNSRTTVRISLIVTGHFANNVTGFSTRLRGV